MVTIPHGGLGTPWDEEELYRFLEMSPSHPVGLEQVVLEIKNGSVYLSPSHTVGSEQEEIFLFLENLQGPHPTRWA
ncbi:hypothetical protein [Thermocrinis sp.]|uniref:hypothetical protein n=1 Tax=Thermocrinis sp. TaxID=2024383 RepID=UPI003C0EA6D4